MGLQIGEFMTRKLHLQRSAIEHHKQIGKELLAPFQQLGPAPEQVFWIRDLLPEFLWIDALVQTYGQLRAARVFNDFLSAADQFNCHPKEILDGTIGAFRYISEERRPEFVKNSSSEIKAAVVIPLRHVVSLYPECPMTWMAEGLAQDSEPAGMARDAVLRLIGGKDSYAGFCRALPLNRFFAHKKLRIFGSLEETIQAIRDYPYGDRYRAEAFARSMHNAVMMQRAREDSNTFGWARYFWNRNRDIVPCRI
jgi:hypothetical protein